MLLRTQFNNGFNVCYYMRTSIDGDDGTIGLILTRKDTQLSSDEIKSYEFDYESKEGIVEQEKINDKQVWYKSPFKYSKMNMI